MAEVYLAKCFGVAGFERLVALKRILPTIAEDDEFIAMFIDEAKIAGQLNHANVAQIFDLGKINQSYFIAMEYISGHDLRALWDRAREAGGTPIELACYVTKKICEGLDYAHRRRDNRGRPLGIIHRDVSPQNVLLSYDGDVKVIDFGIAKAANRMVRTQTGILKGKFAYMAPEQARGEPTDHRSDVFAIGVILYELLTGERAFKADSDFALLEKVRKVDMVPPRKIKGDIPRELEKIVYKAMAREAGDRYAWASVMASDIDRFMTNHGLTYNKEELAAFVRGSFKEDFDEEKRRLAVYKAFKLDGDEAAANGAPGETGEIDPDMQTQLKVDPSISEESAEDQIHEAGTEIGDAYEEPPSSEAEEDSAEYTQRVGEEASASPASAAGSTSPALGARRSTRAVRVSADESGEDESLFSGSPVGGQASRPEAATRLLPAAEEAPSHVDASTRVFSREELAEVSDEDDATMVDSNPITSDPEKMAARAEKARNAKNGASPATGPNGETSNGTDARSRPKGRPDRRGTALGEVLDDERGPATSATIPGPEGADDGVPRAKQHHDPNIFSGPNRPRRPTGVHGNGRPAEADARPERETFPVPRNVPEPSVSQAAGGGVPKPLAAGLAVGGVLVGLLFGGIVGGLVGSFAGGGYDTLIVTNPPGAQVRLNEAVVCESTPCTASLGEGTHELIFEAKGYDPLSHSALVGADEDKERGFTVVEVPLPKRRSGIVLKTAPEGARVELDGKRLTGETPLKLPMLVVGDKVRMKISLKGYDTIEELLEVPELQPDQPWSFEMSASSTEWTVSALPEDAIIEPSGGRPKDGKTSVRVKRGESVAVRVVRPGCEPANISLQGTGQPEEAQQVELTCRPLDEAKLTVRSKTRLLVAIDGVDLGRRTVSDYALPAGEYDVTLKSRKKEERARVQLKKGESFVLDTGLRW